ncbi:VCBS repeat-containing protein [Flavitalea antarctica]
MKKILSLIFLIVSACTLTAQQKSLPLFTKLAPSATGIIFTNMIREDDSLHIMKYEYLYNGHGAGIGDFNNDGLPDVFISGNTVASKLYLNTGKLHFEDVTSRAGLTHKNTWATGVSIADVNGDGLQDIYVSHSGAFQDPAKLANELWINQGVTNGVPSFKDEALAYGLDAPGTQSTQALFLDYDLDGDLDMFLLNHSNHTYNPFLNTRKIRSEPNLKFGNRLFRNDKKGAVTSFTDVTREAGIVNNALNFGLSVNASDINGDGYPDIYTTSDYTEKDCLYLNNGNGTFTEKIEQSVAHMSKYSMGSDIADYNNDGRVDILTLDMLPADNYRQKLLKGPDEYDQYHMLADSGYYYQQMRNMLQLNQGSDRNGNLVFSEIGQLAGISNTDWSWAGLFADFDNDGWKDLFVTNGYLRDFTNLDFLKYSVSEEQLREAKKGNFDFKTFNLVKKMPSNKLGSYLFRNRGDLTFEDSSQRWGINEPAVSNGAAYADFDNDGDLDLIVCRNNEPVALYDNNAEKSNKGNYLKLVLKGKGDNTAAFGAKVQVYTKSLMQLQELYPVRGYQSSVSTSLHFGLGKAAFADSIKVTWPDGSISIKYHEPGNRAIVFDYVNASPGNNLTGNRGSSLVYKAGVQSIPGSDKSFVDITAGTGIKFVHKENQFVDFKGEVLLPYQLSRSGPALASADVNGDGLHDVFLGGAIEQSSILYLQNTAGSFTPAPSQPWATEPVFENVNAIFFDAEGDGDQDLYIVSGGNEYADGSPEYGDRLFLNDGKGNFSLSKAFSPMLSSKKAVAAGDFDKDGDLDLFVGGQSVPGLFPNAARSFLLRNDSKNDLVAFTDVTAEVAPKLLNPGIINEAVWMDLNNDNYPELMLAGEWMPLELFVNNMGSLVPANKSGLEGTNGLWCSLTPTDIDGDGDIDFIAGNAGLNTQLKASPSEPMEMYVADFDNNGTPDPLICYYIDGKSYPMASRDELLEQMPGLKKKFIYYKDYASSNLQSILTKPQLQKAVRYTVTGLSSLILYNKGNLVFDTISLPLSAQFSNLNGVMATDINNDGKKDLVTAGNFYPYRVQLGRSAGSVGLILLGDKERGFNALDPAQSNFFATGDVRKLIAVPGKSGTIILLAKNNGAVQVYQLQ